MSEKKKMLEGELYDPRDPELQADLAENRVWMEAYNTTAHKSMDARYALLQQRLGRVGSGVIIRPPFFCDYGYNIRVGEQVFMSFNCVILDVATVSIGDRTKIGPAVQIYAAEHPRDPVKRKTGLELGRPVIIGANVWIGGGAIILPGVTIGDDAVIGAGSVVTKSVAAGETVTGNPARKLPN